MKENDEDGEKSDEQEEDEEEKEEEKDFALTETTLRVCIHCRIERRYKELPQQLLAEVLISFALFIACANARRPNTQSSCRH